MPAFPSLRVSALADLAEQLKFVPPEAARRHIERAESLLQTVEPDRTYPEDWIVHHVTGYRPDLPEPAMIVGAALLADLGALCERLSARARFQTPELRGWLSIADLCARWHVSRRTLERYRSMGLIGRRARNPRRPDGDGKEVVLFSPAVVEAFQRRQAPRLADAGAFSRIDDALSRRLVRRAARYRRVLGLARGEVSRRLGERFGRSPDAIRRLLMRHDDLHAAEAAPIFTDPPPATDRQARMVERAARWCGVGISPRAIAARLRKSPSTVHRLARQQLARRLKALELRAPAAPEFADARRAAKILAPESVRLGLGVPHAPTVPEFVRRTLAAGWPDARVERERAIAMWFLLWRAARAIKALPVSRPAAGAVDRILTDLRWAARLKAELARAEGMLLLKSIETRLGMPLESLPARDAASVLAAAIDALIAPAGGIDRFDPFKGGRAAAPAGIAINRAMSHWETAAAAAEKPVASRATRIVDEVPPALPDWTRRVAPWQAFTEPDPRVRAGLDALDQPTRDLLMRRYGWIVTPPTTLADLATDLGVPARVVTRREHAACAALIDASRSSPEPRAGAE